MAPEARAIVVVIAGIPGAGKTALAEKLVAPLAARSLSRDVVRSAMFMPCSFTDVEKQASFRALLEALRANCQLGLTTVVEGMPFSRDDEFEAVQATAAQHGIETFGIFLDVPVDVAQARVEAQRNSRVPMADDRDAALVAEVAGRFRSLPDDILVLDATRALADLVAETLEHISSTLAVP
jgi:predicted kinase